MSTLTLVRHGQAAVFHQAEGVLSPLGESQACKLAEFWLRREIRFDEVVSGMLARHIGTEQAVAACYRAAKVPWPEVRRDPGWNEYDVPGLIAGLPSPAENGNRRFQAEFEAALSAWLDGGVSTDNVEPWPAFRDRVVHALARVMEGAAGRRVVVFTSGGPIGLCIQQSLGAPDRAFLDVHWRGRNSAVTEFVFTRERFTLDSFNSLAHLEDSGLWSYR